MYFLRDLGFSGVARLQGVRSVLDRDVLTKRAMGMPERTFTAAGELLAPGIRRYQRTL
ncbi:hypothetical protein D3C86_1309670 [compost metagenome]